jgi:hypothetical protein
MPQTCTTSLPLQTTLHEKKGGEKVMANKVTKRQLLSSALALTVSGTMLLGTTMAWFTHEAKTGVNTITTGKLEVDLQDSKGNTLVSKTDVALDQIEQPGKSKAKTYTFKVKNAGTVDGYVKLDLDVTEKPSCGHFSYEFSSDVVAVTYGNSEDVTLTYWLKEEDACNTCAGAEIKATIVASASQKEFVNVSTKEALETALKNPNSHIILSGTIEDAGTLEVAEGVVLEGGTLTGNTSLQVKGDAVIRNVKFENISNGEEEFPKKLSAIYAQSLAGTLVLDGCTFNDIAYEALLCTPIPGANITVKNCTFNSSSEVYRYLQIQSYYKNDKHELIQLNGVSVSIVGNTFNNCQNIKDDTIMIAYLEPSTLSLGQNQFNGNKVVNGIYYWETVGTSGKGKYAAYNPQTVTKALTEEEVVNFQDYLNNNQ